MNPLETELETSRFRIIENLLDKNIFVSGCQLMIYCSEQLYSLGEINKEDYIKYIKTIINEYNKVFKKGNDQNEGKD